MMTMKMKPKMLMMLLKILEIGFQNSNADEVYFADIKMKGCQIVQCHDDNNDDDFNFYCDELKLKLMKVKLMMC